MSVKAQTIFSIIEKIAPKSLAESWDNVGLQVGSYRQDVKRVLLALDVTREVVDEAVEKKADLIIAHHPFIFGGMKRINFDEYQGNLVRTLIQHNIGVYSAHTNLDLAEAGLNTYIADILGLDAVKPLGNDAVSGFGCIGNTDAIDPAKFIQFVKSKLGCDVIRMTKAPDHAIRKVALCTGSGCEFMGLAKRQGADVFITGDMKHHDAQRAVETGIWVIDAGHYGTEKQVVGLFKKLLENDRSIKDVEVLIAGAVRDYMIYQ